MTVLNEFIVSPIPAAVGWAIFAVGVLLIVLASFWNKEWVGTIGAVCIGVCIITFILGIAIILGGFVAHKED